MAERGCLSDIEIRPQLFANSIGLDEPNVGRLPLLRVCPTLSEFCPSNFSKQERSMSEFQFPKGPVIANQHRSHLVNQRTVENRLSSAIQVRFLLNQSGKLVELSVDAVRRNDANTLSAHFTHKLK